MRSRSSLLLTVLAACGPPLVTDDEPTLASAGDGEGASPTHGTSDEGDEPPDPSAAEDEGPSELDVAMSGSDGGTQLDVGSTDGVCTDTACFGPAQTIDETPAHAVAILDIDADGNAELVVGTDAGLRIYELRNGIAVATATIETLGRVIAIAHGTLDVGAAGDLVAITDAARVVVVLGGSTPLVTTLAASDALVDVAISPAVDGSPAFATVGGDGTLSWWRPQGGGWVPSFFGVDARPSALAVGASQGSSVRLVAIGDHSDDRLDVLAIDGTILTAVAEYPWFDNDPVQIEAGPLAIPGTLPELIVLGDDPAALEIHGFAAGVDTLYGEAVLSLTGQPVAFATGAIGYGDRGVAVIDGVAGTVELCALVVEGEYQPACPGTVLAVGVDPVAIAIGELDGSPPADLAIASATAGTVVITGVPPG